MKQAVVLRHLPIEGVGNFESALRRSSYRVTYYDAGVHEPWTLDLSQVDLLVVMGTIGPWDEETFPFVREELAVVEQRLHSRRPLLGVGYGAGLIARALGARAPRQRASAIGFAPLTLNLLGRSSVLSEIESTDHVLQFCTYNLELPSECEPFATSRGSGNQAFAWGAGTLALTFRIEVDFTCFEPWLIAHGAELDRSGVSIHDLRADASRHAKRSAAIADRMMTRWLAGIEAMPGQYR